MYSNDLKVCFVMLATITDVCWALGDGCLDDTRFGSGVDALKVLLLPCVLFFRPTTFGTGLILKVASEFVHQYAVTSVDSPDR